MYEAPAAYRIDTLESKDLITLSSGCEDPVGNRAVISARTGLGMAGLYWDGFRHHPFACEGGHSGFSPANDLEMELLHYLQQKYGRVSSERVLSGPGIKNIYDFLQDTGKAEEPSLASRANKECCHGPALISQIALENKAKFASKHSRFSWVPTDRRLAIAR